MDKEIEAVALELCRLRGEDPNDGEWSMYGQTHLEEHVEGLTFVYAREQVKALALESVKKLMASNENKENPQ